MSAFVNRSFGVNPSSCWASPVISRGQNPERLVVAILGRGCALPPRMTAVATPDKASPDVVGARAGHEDQGRAIGFWDLTRVKFTGGRSWASSSVNRLATRQIKPAKPVPVLCNVA